MNRNQKDNSRQPDQQRWKRLFEGSLNRLNGRDVPIFQQPIFRRKPDRSTALDTESSKSAIETAADSLAALWQIANPRRHGI